MKSVEIIISGIVQGVFFRQYTLEKAEELEIKGTVENMDDGTVRIFAEGEKDKMKDFISWCHRGSPKSEVEKVDVKDIPAKNFKNFVIKH